MFGTKDKDESIQSPSSDEITIPNSRLDSSEFKVGLFRGLRFRLALMLILLLTILIGISWWTAKHQLSAPVIAASTQLQATRLALLGSEIESELSEIEQLLQQLSSTVRLIPTQALRLKSLLPLQLDESAQARLILGGGYWPEPYALDRKRAVYSLYWSRQLDGRLVPRKNFDMSAAKGGYQSKEWYAGAMVAKSGQPYWSEAYLDPISQQWVMTCSLSVNDGTRNIGVVSINVSINALDKHLTASTAKLKNTEFARFWLLDRNNRLIAKNQLGVPKRTAATRDPVLISAISGDPAAPKLDKVLNELNNEIVRRTTEGPNYSAETISRFRKIAPDVSRVQAERSLASLWLPNRVLAVIEPINLPGDNPKSANEARISVLRQGHLRIALETTKAETTALLEKQGFQAFQIILIAISAMMFLLYLLVSGTTIKPLRQVLGQLLAQRDMGDDESRILNIPGNSELSVIGRLVNERDAELRELVDKNKADSKRLSKDGLALKTAQNQLAHLEKRQQAFYQILEEPLLILSKRRVIEYVNPAAEAHSGLKLGNCVGKHLSEVLIAHTATGDLLDHRIGYILTGETAPEDVEISTQGDEQKLNVRPQLIKDEQGKIIQCMLLFSAPATAVTETATAVDDASVRIDMLTGLPTRRQFEQNLAATLNEVNAGSLEASVAFIDVDRLERVNDTSGHEAGDELLKQIGQVISGTIGSTGFDATAYRLEADKFTVIACDLNDEDMLNFVESIRDQIALNGFVWDGHNYQISVSAGLQKLSPGMNDVVEIQRRAYTACQSAKDSGRNQVVVASEEMDVSEHHNDEHIWVERIRRGIEQNLFHLTTQPIRNIVHLGSKEKDAKTLCFEALVQLEDEEGFWNAPGSFLPIAEKYNLSNEIDRWVVREVFSHLGKNPDELNRIEFCSINVTGPALVDEGFVDFVIKQFGESGIPPEKICFEISEESITARLSAARAFIEPLHQYGCKISIDDFSTGLSGIKVIGDIPVHFIKLDHRLTSDLEDKINFITVDSLLKIAAVRNTQVIVAHIEDSAQLKSLQKMGFSYAQGFGIGRPSPVLFQADS